MREIKNDGVCIWMRLFVPILFSTFITSTANADISYIESGIGITFEGCDYNKIINLENGYAWECSEYGYKYHYGKLTVLKVNGTAKICVGDLEEAIEEYPEGDCYKGTLFRLR